MNLERFREHVKEALAHLYDGPYLETHPLAALLTPQHTGEVRGHALQRTLQEAIQALKPNADLPYESLAWRKYRYLYLRYVQSLSAPEIASDLGISPRQARRYSQEALAAVTQILWDRFEGVLWQNDGLPSGRQAQTERAGDARAGITSVSAAVDQEVALVEATATEAAVPVGELLMGVVSTIRPLAERWGVGLEASLPADLPSAAIERTMLRQALLSVLSLSLELAGAAVELSVEPVADEPVLRLLVRCQTAVAPGRLLDRLRADDRWRIAQHLLEARGGGLEAWPELAGQVTVCLRVPTARDSTVLIVEDNPDAILLYRRYLGDSPFRVVAAADGGRAVECAEAEQPAAIILDVMMPGRDGWEVLQVLKSHPSTRHIPVVVCSVLKERDLALALGAAEFLVKPISRPDLLRALGRYSLGGSAGRRG